MKIIKSIRNLFLISTLFTMTIVSANELRQLELAVGYMEDRVFENSEWVKPHDIKINWAKKKIKEIKKKLPKVSANEQTKLKKKIKTYNKVIETEIYYSSSSRQRLNAFKASLESAKMDLEMYKETH